MPGKSTAAVTVALDRAASLRAFDQDGHLHVPQVHVTRAGVSPYLGHEIPHWERLGLERGRVYQLFRDPVELERAAPTLNNKPLLFGHNPVHAENHDHARTVGVVSKPMWNPPYLDADMACWSGPAIECIKDDSQKELSSAYHYTAVMEPGLYEGQAFDGRMVGISFNHVGLVPKGRVGSDCVVTDSAEAVLAHLSAAADAAQQIVAAQDSADASNGRAGPEPLRGATQGKLTMSATPLTRAGAHVQGALSVYLRPKLAQDAKVDLGPHLKGLTAKNYHANKPALVLGIQKACHGKLAQDETIDDLGAVIDAVEEAIVEEVADQSGQSEADVAAEAEGEKPAADAGMDGVKGFLKEQGLDDEAVAKVVAMIEALEPEADPAPRSTVTGDDAPKPGKPAMDAADFVKRSEVERIKTEAVAAATKGMLGKPAMDAAIAAAVKVERQRQTDLRAAEDFVRPWVGKLSVACDSAEAVHRAALTVLGQDHKDIHASALPTIIALTPKPGDAPRPANRAQVAQDAARNTQTYDEMFPNAGRLAS